MGGGDEYAGDSSSSSGLLRVSEPPDDAKLRALLFHKETFVEHDKFVTMKLLFPARTYFPFGLYKRRNVWTRFGAICYNQLQKKCEKGTKSRAS